MTTYPPPLGHENCYNSAIGRNTQTTNNELLTDTCFVILLYCHYVLTLNEPECGQSAGCP